ncbi:MAG: hypothetical protein ABR498_09950 [Candidatus Dormibacteria bacterium]
MLTAMGALCLFGLINAFGQQPVITTLSNPTASLTVESPERLRGGLVFTTAITVVAHADVHDAQLLLSKGWWDGMTLNAVAPQSNMETSDARGITFDYGELQPGDTLHVWISWQVNATTVGNRDQNVVLSDGSQQVIAMPRSYTIFF